MRRKNDYITEYKNGNITIKYDAELIEQAREGATFVLSEVLYWMDCYIEEDDGTEMLIHNVQMDVWYRFYRYPSDEMERLLSGKTVRLYAFKKGEDEE